MKEKNEKMRKPVENLTPDKPANADDVRASARNAKAMRRQCAHSEGVVTTPNMRAKAGKYVCEVCGAEFDSQQALAAHMKKHKNKAQAGAPPTQEEEIIKSPKEKLEEWFISELERWLPKIVGKQATDIILETIKENPDMIWDSRYLKYHIIQLGPRNMNDYLLDFALTGLYEKLQESKAKIERISGFMLPVIKPPESTLGWGSRVTPPRDRHWDEELERSPHNEPDRRMPGPRHQPEESITTLITTLLKSQLDFQSQLIKKLFEKEEGKGEKKIPIRNPFGEGIIEVPESQVLPYMMMIMSTTSRGEKEEATITIPTEEGPKKMTPQEAITYLLFKQGQEKAKTEEEKRKALEEELKATRQQVMEMSRALAPENLAKAVEQLGYRQSSSPTYNLLKDLVSKLPTKDDLKEAVGDIITMRKIQSRPPQQTSYTGYIPQPPGYPYPQQTPGAQAPEYTEEEIEKKTQDTLKKFEKAQKLGKLEKEIVKITEAE